MTSNDNNIYIREDVFNARMDTLMAQIQLSNEMLRNELRSEIQAVDANVKVNAAKIEMLEHTFYWGFAIMTLIITLVAVVVPYFLREHKERKQDATSTANTLTEEKVQRMINEALNDVGIKAIGK